MIFQFRAFRGIGGETPDQGHSLPLLNEVK